MEEYILAAVLIFVFIGNIVASIWICKQNCKEERIQSAVILGLQRELERHNDETFGKKQEE